jgi:DNA-binding transcriptional ArsR family regulator
VGLCEHECNVGLIQEKLKIPQATVSQHLRILRMLGIVEERREGKKKCYQVNNETVKKIIDILNSLE